MSLSTPKQKYQPATALKLSKTNPQVADTDIIQPKCRHCQARCVKAGKERSGKQRYVCTVCKKRQVATFDYHAYHPDLDQNIIALTKEGVGIRGTARLLGISPTTLISRIKKIASEIKEPVLAKGKTYEVDELRTFVKKKES